MLYECKGLRIYVGDFNVCFVTNDSIHLTIFHEQKFDLKIKNKQTELQFDIEQ